MSRCANRPSEFLSRRPQRGHSMLPVKTILRKYKNLAQSSNESLTISEKRSQITVTSRHISLARATRIKRHPIKQYPACSETSEIVTTANAETTDILTLLNKWDIKHRITRHAFSDLLKIFNNTQVLHISLPTYLIFAKIKKDIGAS